MNLTDLIFVFGGKEEGTVLCPLFGVKKGPVAWLNELFSYAQLLVSCLSSRGLGICYNTDESKENQSGVSERHSKYGKGKVV